MLSRDDLVGSVCTSAAGHDKNEYYVIVSVLDSKHVGVADGKTRTIAKPKKKNLRHLKIQKARIVEIDKLLNGEPVSSNLALVSILRALEDASVR